MKHSVHFFIITILLSCGLIFLGTTPSAAQTESAPFVPYDILHYQLDVNPDWSARKARMKAIISLQFLQSGKKIRLSARDIYVSQIKTGTVVLPFNWDSSRQYLELHWNKNNRTGEKTDITITYETSRHNEPDPNAPGGSFGRGIRFFQPGLTNPSKRKQVWVQSDIVNTSSWLPGNPDIADQCTVECKATLDAGLDFISNGKLVSVKTNSDSSRSFHYQTLKPAPLYQAVFAAGEYKELRQQINGISLYTYCYPDETEAAKATTVQLPAMLRFMEEKTGITYPFYQYRQVMVQDYPFPGLSGQNAVSIISDNMIDDEGTHRDYLYLWDGVEMNALASQWFGNLIFPKTMADLWLTRSFAQYFEGLYSSAIHGKEEYLLWYHPFETASIFGDWNNGNRHPVAPPSVTDRDLFNTDSYSKFRGALVLRLLQLELGDSLFFKTIRHFVKRFAGHAVTTRQFQDLIREISGRNMDWFFDQWIYHTGHPVFDISSTYDEGKKQLKVRIRQVQEKNPAVKDLFPGFFQGKMGIEINQRKVIIQILPKEEQEFVFDQPLPPAVVNPDMEHQWIREIRYKRNISDWLQILNNGNDTRLRNTAMTELVKWFKDSTATWFEKNAIRKAFEKAIMTPSYWRFRFNAIGQYRQICSIPDSVTRSILISLIQEERYWIKAAAITSLGMSNDTAYQDLYIHCLNDSSDRVVNAAAIALGKTKGSRAFQALIQLKSRPSWKNQSLMHCLNGLAQLGHPETEPIALAALADNHSPRWFLGNGWDYPFVAAQTLSAIGKTEKAYPLLLERFRLAMKEGNTDDIFYQVLLMATLGDQRAVEIFAPLKEKFREDANAMLAIQTYEEQFKPAK